MGSSSGEESGSSPSSSSSSSSSSGREEDKAVRASADPRAAPASTSSAPDGEEDSNAGFADPESPNSKADSSSSSSEGVLVEHPVPSNQDPRYLQGDQETGILVDFDGSVQEHTEGEEEYDRNQRGEDSSREDMFEDAPDQLAYSEGRRSIGLEESMAMIEIGESNREKQLIDEVAKMHAQLNGTVVECQRYKEERELMQRDLTTLRLQLQSLTDRQSQVASGNAGEIEHLGQEETPTQLQSILTDCTRFASHLQTRLDEQLQSEATITELHSVIYSKDQEIEDLNMKLSEFSVSRDLIASYMGSARDLQLETAKETSDAAMKRLLDSLAFVTPLQYEDSGDSGSQDIFLVEKKTEALIEKYGKIVHETKQLGQFLTAFRSDFAMPPNDDQLDLVFEETRKELKDRSTTEMSCLEKINVIEQEKFELLQQLEQVKVNLEESKVEANKAKADHEQAENKLASAKEKLSMAVTKGKSLVQHRDSLKQSLAEKAHELERCVQALQQKSDALETVEETVEELRKSQELLKQELQEKSIALQAAEESAEELVKNYELVKQELEQKSIALEAAEEAARELRKSQELVLSLQNTITERENVLLKIDEAISMMDTSPGLNSMDIIERVQWLMGALLENRRIQDALSSFDLPETISSALLDRVNWLTASYAETNRELTRLQDELANTHSALESCQSELVEVREEIKKTMESLSFEKQGKDSLQELHDDLASRYQEIEEKLSQISLQKIELVTVLEEVTECKMDGEKLDDIYNFVKKCKEQIKGRMELGLESSSLLSEGIHMIQTSLFLKTLESSLYGRLLEEDMMAREEVKKLSNEMYRASQEVVAVRNEKDSLQKDFERVEERSALLREKLSMAVKKGKGLMQERENLKHSLDEKNSEIEKLKEKLKLQELSIVECSQNISNLTAELASAQKLVSVERENFKDSLDGKNSEIENLKEKLKLQELSLIECNVNITNLTEELANAQKLESLIVSVKEERNQIESSLLESNNTLRKLVQSIEKIVLPSDSTFKSPVEKLHQIAQKLIESEAGKAHAEKELQKLKEKAILLANKLEDSNLTMKSLEEALSEAENKVSLVIEEKENAEMSKASVEQELEKLKEEAGRLASKLENTSQEVMLLQNTLSEAENRISLLVEEIKESESRSRLEIDSLNAKLATCMEELVGESGSLKSQSADLYSQLKHLESFTKDDNIMSLMTDGFGRNIGNLRNVIHSFKDIHDHLYSHGLESYYDLEQDNAFSKLLVFPQLDDFIKDENLIPHINLEGPVDHVPSLTKFAEGISSQMKLLMDRVAYFSNYIADVTTLMLEAVGETKGEIIKLVELKDSLQLNVTELEADHQRQTRLVASIDSDSKVLLSACGDAIQTLQIDYDALQNQQHSSEEFSTTISDLGGLDSERNSMSEYVKAAQTLLHEVGKKKVHLENLCNAKNAKEREIEVLRKKLEEVESTAQFSVREKDIDHERANNLEKELDSLKIFCKDLQVRIHDYQGKALEWKDKKQELSLLQSQLSKKDRGESWSVILNQLETLFNEVDRIEIPFKEIHMEGTEMQLSTSMDKIFYVVSNVSTLQRIISNLTIENESMQSDLTVQADEIKHLKTVVDRFTSDNQELKRKESDITELIMNMERIIQKAGGADFLEDMKPADAKSFLIVLERLLLVSIQESESSKSKVQDLGSRLQVSQTVVDELAEKIKVLESSVHSRPPLPESKDRSIFDASSSIAASEISEIEDTGSLGKKLSSSVPAAHSRTTRKGSTDHLALDIDLESERLITSYETEEKGHLFKSLNTSGLIPKQGKLIADRVDSIWVSGGRILMARPKARIGLIVYWLLLHIWLLGSIL